MQIKLFINRNAIVHYILITCLFLTISCEGCRQKPLEREKDKIKVVLQTDKVETMGSVNTTQLVLKVSGEIKENLINEPTSLCVLVVPKGGSARDAAKEFRESNTSLDKNYITLDNKKKEVYYASEIPANKKGMQEVKVFLQGELPSAQYEAYLMLHSKSHGTYCSESGKEFEIPNVANLTTIEIVSGKAKEHINVDTAVIKITAQADAKNFGTMEGGFLFIEKKDPKISSVELLGEFIKEGKLLHTTNGFEEEVPGIIIRSFDDGAGGAQAKDHNNLDGDDTENLFKKDSKYNVYAYLVESAGGQHRYVVSEEEREITISKLEVELEIEKAEIAALIKDVGDQAGKPKPNYDYIQFNFKGNIIKNKDTKKPQVGFLFVAGGPVASSQDAIVRVEQLLAAPAIDKFHKDGSGDVIYVKESIASNTTGEVSDSPHGINIPLELGKNYHVYFWLRDESGEVFVSSSNVILSVPNVELNVKEFRSKRLGDKGFEVIHQEDIIPKNHDGRAKTIVGYLVVDDRTSIQKEFFEKILMNEKLAKPFGGDTLNEGKAAFFKNSFLDQNPAYTDSEYSRFFKNIPNTTSYTVYLFYIVGNAFFYKKASDDKKFIWYEPAKTDTDKKIENFEYENTIATYYIDYKFKENKDKNKSLDFEYAWITRANDTDPGRDVIKKGTVKRDLVDALLKEHFQGGNPEEFKILSDNFFAAMK